MVMTKSIKVIRPLLYQSVNKETHPTLVNRDKTLIVKKMVFCMVVKHVKRPIDLWVMDNLGGKKSLLGLNAIQFVKTVKRLVH